MIWSRFLTIFLCFHLGLLSFSPPFSFMLL
jgi:hypothetical protein